MVNTWEKTERVFRLIINSFISYNNTYCLSNV